MNKSIVMVCLLAVSACGAPALDIQTSPVTVDVKRSVPNAQIGQYTGHTVRSYMSVEGKPTEVAGARCTISSNEISAQVVTPASVVMVQSCCEAIHCLNCCHCCAVACSGATALPPPLSSLLTQLGSTPQSGNPAPMAG